MKEEAKKKLIKDSLAFVITAAIILLIFIVAAIGNLGGFREIAFSEGVGLGIVAIILVPLIMGFEVAGVAIGWKVLSQKVSARNLLGLLIKVGISVLIGYILFPVTIVKDIIAYVKA